jgi:DNA-binding transcriptional LysR family regulator
MELRQMQQDPDLNLLVGLQALLEEGSVTGAARRLHRSVSATSRILGHIRTEFNDPILVRSGRDFVLTERAISLRDRLSALLEEARSLSIDETTFDPGALHRDFLIVASEAVLAFLGGPLVAHFQRHAPHVRCAFVVEGREQLLRDSPVDLVIGATRTREPEIRLESVLVDRLVGVCRADHPLVTLGVTTDRYLAAQHLVNSRPGNLSASPLDQQLGIKRTVVASAPIVMSLWILLETELVGVCYERLEGPTVRALGLRTFEIPYEHEPITVSQAWHPRHDNDIAHLWLRRSVRDVVDGLVGEDRNVSSEKSNT